MTHGRATWQAELERFAGSARFAQALTVIAIAIGFSTHAIRALMGWPGLLGAVLVLAVLCGVSIIARWRTVEWYGILPLTLLVFVGWCAASVLWAATPGLTAVRVLYLVLFGFLGVYIALSRDTIQIVRAFGDVFRLLLTVSIALEVFSGILIDLPIVFLGIEGDIANLGPLQGIFGSRNLLGFVSLLALVTFIIEWRTRSVRRAVGIGSTLIASGCLLLSGSPTTFITLAAVAVSAAALTGLRRVAAPSRWKWQAGALAVVIATLTVAFVMRARIIEALDARAEFNVRVDLWQELSRYLALNPLQGWGWVGFWPDSVPYTWVEAGVGRNHATGLSAYIDVYFQVGVIGALVFAALLGVASARSWLLASNRRSIVYLWPALVLVVIAVTSFAESFALVEAGWLVLVVCVVKAAREMSWRDALRELQRD